VLIVVTVLGFLMTVLAAAFVVVVRTVPDTEDRLDDSRSLLGLTNWLSQDVMSASAHNGFDVLDADPASPSCEDLPASSVNLLELSWSDVATYVVNYRYVEQTATTGAIIRYSCVSGGTPAVVRVTSDLENGTSGAFAPAPVEITLKPFVLPDGTAGIEGLEFRVFVYENGSPRELLSLDAATSNIGVALPTTTVAGSTTTTSPATSVPTTPPVTPNQPPLAVPFSVTSNNHDEPPILYTMVGVYDPEGVPLTFDFVQDTDANPNPSNWTIGVSYDAATGYYVAAITPPPQAPTSPSDPAYHGTWVFDYSVSDGVNDLVWSTLTATFDHSATTTTTTAPPPFITTTTTTVPVAPTAAPAAMVATKGQPSGPLSLAANVWDENGGPLTISFPSLPSGWTASATGFDVMITPPANAAPSTEILYRVTDSGGLYAESTITVSTCHVTSVSISPPTVEVVPGGHLAGPVTITVDTNGACSGLVATFKPKSSQATQFEAFESGPTATIPALKYAWDNANRTVSVEIRASVIGAVENSATFQTTKK
jgi:hypothetical protein